jgi:protein-L-isoaspartate(D-aspartate) O-methyltransferase
VRRSKVGVAVWRVRAVRGNSNGNSRADFRQQRINMVESQVRPSDITDRRIVRALLEVAREAFVPQQFAPIAYIDGPVPVALRTGAGDGRHLLPPRTFAKLLQLAGLGPESVVLDVGCATGYSTAVLAKLASRVVAVEAEPSLARQASRHLQELGAGNAVVVEGSHAGGAPAEAPFDAILLNGAVPAVPSSLLQQLADGGRLAAMLSEGPLCRAHVWRRGGKAIDCQPAFEGAAAPLPGFERPAGFVF